MKEAEENVLGKILKWMIGRFADWLTLSLQNFFIVGWALPTKM
jgi:hypothetical protein